MASQSQEDERRLRQKERVDWEKDGGGRLGARWRGSIPVDRGGRGDLEKDGGGRLGKRRRGSTRKTTEEVERETGGVGRRG